MRSSSKIILINMIITLILVIVFDIFTYFFLPGHYVNEFEEYRYVSRPPGVGGGGSYPNGYFVKRSDRGFDIRANRSAHHWVDGITYPIWSNSLGCFDGEHNKSGPYVYLAGDSFAWGFVPNEQHFGTIIEKRTGQTIFKCGVIHTGQRHQYAKLVEIIDQISEIPQAVFIFYYSNDIANDYAYPHSTVIRGWHVDNVFIDENDKLIRLSSAELKDRLEKRLHEIEIIKSQRGFMRKAKRAAKFYSLSINIGDYIRDYLLDAMSQTYPSDATESTQEQSPSLRSLRSLYQIPQEKNGRFWYAHNPFAQQNKEAILNFKRLVVEYNTNLAVVLIPPKSQAGNTRWYEELREFLNANEIRHIDLTEAFADRKIEATDIYWRNDGHFSPSGGDLVATIVIEAFPDIFGPGNDVIDGSPAEVLER